VKTRAQKLFELGQSVWLDYIRRGQLVSGEFDRLREQGVVGVTSNPTIFHLAIAESQDYDRAIHEHASRGLEGSELFESLAIPDIQDACDRLRGVFESTQGRDGRVSLEVNPHLAHDTQRTVAEARRLHSAVARPNLMIKVPATEQGLPAIRTLTAEGMCVNVTLTFSLARYEQVMDAYLSGLEDRLARAQRVEGIHSVASFFVSRVDTKVDKAIEARLARLPASAPERSELEGYRGKAAIANARVAYARFREVFGGPRFQALRARGALLQRPLWASTSTKNPAYRDVLYVEELIGPDTVDTMPPATLQAFNDHGEVEVRIDRELNQARRLFQRLPELGIPVDALIVELEAEGVTAFAKSYDALMEALRVKRRELVA
jgi:transaldolase